MNASDEFEFELPNRGGDDRVGLEDLDELEVSEDLEDDDDDYPDDAGEDDIDLVVALYREDGTPVALPLELDLANDLEGLITQLRRMPGDAGAVAMVSVDDDLFVILRVRGKHVQVFCSDAVAANEWPIARDVVDFLDLEVPEEGEDGYSIGDAEILADAGMPDFELEAMAEDYEEDATTLLERIATKVGFGPSFAKALASFE